jgi:hypothetical protein
MAIIGTTIAGTIGAITLDAIGQLAIIGGVFEGGKRIVDNLFTKTEPKTSDGKPMSREDFGKIEVPLASGIAALKAGGEEALLALIASPSKVGANTDQVKSIMDAVKAYEDATDVFVAAIQAAMSA